MNLKNIYFIGFSVAIMLLTVYTNRVYSLDDAELRNISQLANATNTSYSVLLGLFNRTNITINTTIINETIINMTINNTILYDFDNSTPYTKSDIISMISSVNFSTQSSRIVDNYTFFGYITKTDKRFENIWEEYAEKDFVNSSISEMTTSFNAAQSRQDMAFSNALNRNFIIFVVVSIIQAGALIFVIKKKTFAAVPEKKMRKLTDEEMGVQEVSTRYLNRSTEFFERQKQKRELIDYVLKKKLDLDSKRHAISQINNGSLDSKESIDQELNQYSQIKKLGEKK